MLYMQKVVFGGDFEVKDQSSSPVHSLQTPLQNPVKDQRHRVLIKRGMGNEEMGNGEMRK